MRYGIIFIMWTLCIGCTEAQTIEEARKLFNEKKYAEAVPLFETIVKSTARRNVAIKPEAYRLLGDCYYFLYEFEKSAQAYSRSGDLTVTSLKERSERAARMLSHCEDIQIIDSVITDKKDFLSAYFLSGECGTLKNEKDQASYENPLKNKRYFSAENKEGKYRLYSEIRLQNEWENQRELNLPSDSAANDNYPFVLQDGLTLYFASTGENSIGGYDLFITRYNLNNDTYLVPNQLGMPFNSIANDYMLAIDEIHHIGYFATDRFQSAGKVIVYTFIPNEEITPVQTENEKILMNRAKITSIRDSWQSGKNYKSYIADIRRSISSEQANEKRDFFFVLNDQVVYDRLDSFKDDAAKQAFIQSIDLEKDIKQSTGELEMLRLEYAQASNAKKANMQTAILAKEKRLDELIAKHKQAVANARTFELRRLKIKY